MKLQNVEEGEPYQNSGVWRNKACHTTKRLTHTDCQSTDVCGEYLRCVEIYGHETCGDSKFSNDIEHNDHRHPVKIKVVFWNRRKVKFCNIGTKYWDVTLYASAAMLQWHIARSKIPDIFNVNGPYAILRKETGYLSLHCFLVISPLPSSYVLAWKLVADLCIKSQCNI